ncbi:Hsp20 family protein [Klebsiella quasipneumoniae]|uniref:Hsp20 family protein n=1 Tax=Klebsiella quasipneumoniae TaxID=1463165 RepID=UPI003D9FDFEB
MGEISVKTGNNARNGGKNSLNRLIRCVCGKKIGPDPRNFNQRVSLGRNDLLIRTFLSVPGWKDDELEIETVGGNLHITGKRAQTENHSGGSQGWIYKGIRRADFQLSFSLPEHAQINQAQLDSGILKIAIHQEIPESEKPRKIAIENQGRVIEHKV